MRRMRMKSWMRKTDDESEEHVSEEIAEREEDLEHRNHQIRKTALEPDAREHTQP